MRRYLDKEWENEKLTGARINDIEKRICSEYGVNLKKALEKGELEDIRARIADECLGGSNNMPGSISLDVEEGERSLIYPSKSIICCVRENIETEIEKDRNTDIKEKRNREDIISLFEKLMGCDLDCSTYTSSNSDFYGRNEEKVDVYQWSYFAKNKSIENAWKEWAQMIDDAVRNEIIFDLDFRIKSFILPQYLLLSKKTNKDIGENVNKGAVDPITRMARTENLPLANIKKRHLFVEDLLNVLLTQRYIRVFEFEPFGNELKENKKNEREDVVRFSYHYVKEIYEKIRDTGLENYYYLDDMLGVSLTNVIYNCIIVGHNNMHNFADIQINENYTEQIFEIARLLGSIKSVYGRNYIAQIVFCFLFQWDFSKKMVYQVYYYLKDNIGKYNKFFGDICDIMVWEIFYDIQKWSEAEMKSFTEELGSRLKDRVQNNLCDENVEEELGNSKRKQMKRAKKIKDPEYLYIEIHKKVMEGIWVK